MCYIVLYSAYYTTILWLLNQLTMLNELFWARSNHLRTLAVEVWPWRFRTCSSSSWRPRCDEWRERRQFGAYLWGRNLFPRKIPYSMRGRSYFNGVSQPSGFEWGNQRHFPRRVKRKPRLWVTLHWEVNFWENITHALILTLHRKKPWRFYKWYMIRYFMESIYGVSLPKVPLAVMLRLDVDFPLVSWLAVWGLLWTLTTLW